MQIVIIFGFILARVLLDLPLGAHTSPGRLAAGVGGYLAVAAGIGLANSRLSLSGLRRQGVEPGRVLKRHNVMMLLASGWLLLGLGGLFAIGLREFLIGQLRLDHIPLATTAAAMAPFVLAMLVIWSLNYPVSKYLRLRAVPAPGGPAAGPAVWSFGEYLSYNLRHQFLFVAAPVAAIIFISDALAVYGRWALADMGISYDAAEWVVQLGTIAAAGAVFIVAPVMIVHIWRTRRLPAGPLRSELEELFARLRIRCRDILIWESGGVIANAGAMGLIAPVRYVLLSDALLAGMDRRQIHAIFAHEAGHVTSHHIFYSMLFIISGIVLCTLAAELVAMATGAELWVSQGLALALMVGVLVYGFGWLSRRFERQSDVIGAWVAGGAPADGRITQEGAAIFAQSLMRVAELNGIGLSSPNWRHGTIQHRVNYIIGLGSLAGNRRDTDRLIDRLKLGIWSLVVIAAVAATGLTVTLG